MTKRWFWGLFLALWIAASVWSGKLVYDARNRAELARREAEMAKKPTPSLSMSDPDPFVVVRSQRKSIGCNDGSGYEAIDGVLCWSNSRQVFVLYQVKEQ